MTPRGMALGLAWLAACGHAPSAGPPPTIDAVWQERDPIVHFTAKRLPAASVDGKRVAVLMQGDIVTSGDPWGALAILDEGTGMELERVPLVGGDDWSHAGGQPLNARPEVERRLADANGRLAAWSWVPLDRIAEDAVDFDDPHVTLRLAGGRKVVRDVPSRSSPGCAHAARIVGAWSGASFAVVQVTYRGDVESACGQPNDVWVIVHY